MALKTPEGREGAQMWVGENRRTCPHPGVIAHLGLCRWMALEGHPQDSRGWGAGSVGDTCLRPSANGMVFN